MGATIRPEKITSSTKTAASPSSERAMLAASTVRNPERLRPQSRKITRVPPDVSLTTKR